MGQPPGCGEEDQRGKPLMLTGRFGMVRDGGPSRRRSMTITYRSNVRAGFDH